MWRKEARDAEMSAGHGGAALRYGLGDGGGRVGGWRCVCL